MKLAFCTEDLTDEVLLLAFMNRLGTARFEAHDGRYRLERGGWTKALALARYVARNAFHSTADGAVFAIDNDDAEPLHASTHEDEDGCRHCLLRKRASVDEVVAWSRPELPKLKFLFVVPVRTIETWLCIAAGALRDENPDTFGRTPTERRRLKLLAYGTEHPDQDLAQSRGLALIRDANLTTLRERSASFRLFADDTIALSAV